MSRDARLAIEGGDAVRTASFPPWPPPPSPAQEAALLEVLRSQDWGAAPGGKVEQFATRFAARHEARFGLCLVNATLGLTVGLKTLGIRPGDEVIMPPYTFLATASAALLIGAVPAFADLEPTSMTLDADAVEARVTPRTRAVVPVHLAGCPANMDRLTEVARRHGLSVLEDAAQAHGARWRGRPVGALGDMGCFSFQSSKNMTAGEGGALLTNDPRLHSTAWSLQNVGRVPGGEWYDHERVGWNLRLTAFQAALLLDQLVSLDDYIKKRAASARYLRTRLLSEVEGTTPAHVPEEVTIHAWHLFLLHFAPEAFGGASRDDLVAALLAEGIPCSAGYPLLNHHPAVLQELKNLSGSNQVTPDACPRAESLAGTTFWLPQNVLLGTEEDLEDVVQALRKIQRAGGRWSTCRARIM